MFAIDLRLDEGNGARVGAAADRVLGIAEHLDVLAAVLLEGVDLGIDRAISGSFDHGLDAVRW